MMLLAAIGAFVLAAGAGADAPAPADRGTIVVTLADGTTVPLRNWTFSYEYAVYGKGVSPLAAPTARKDTGDFYLGKRALAPGSLSTVEVQYQQMGALSVARTMTLGLARELAEEGIRVNCVRPGFVHTDIHASGGEPNRIERLRDGIPMKRGGDPEEVARAVLWLLSDEASYSTGAILDVTGGR